eukprot:8134697-Prorocentrum_lima.AAC.1
MSIEYRPNTPRDFLVRTGSECPRAVSSGAYWTLLDIVIMKSRKDPSTMERRRKIKRGRRTYRKKTETEGLARKTERKKV